MPSFRSYSKGNSISDSMQKKIPKLAFDLDFFMLLYFRLLKKHWIVWTDWSQWKRIGEQLHYFNAKWVHQYDTWCVQIVKCHSFQVLLWVSHRGALLWPAVLGSSWNGGQGGFQIKHCLFFSFVSILAQCHTLATLVGESNVSWTTSKPEAHCSHYQQVTFFTAIGIKCSQLYSCKYQRLLITIINFNQSVSRLTILILMTALLKEASVKTSHVFNQP